MLTLFVKWLILIFDFCKNIKYENFSFFNIKKNVMIKIWTLEKHAKHLKKEFLYTKIKNNSKTVFPPGKKHAKGFPRSVCLSLALIGWTGHRTSTSTNQRAC